MTARRFASEIETIEPTSGLNKNMEFIATHPDELENLAHAGIRKLDLLNAIITGCCLTQDYPRSWSPGWVRSRAGMA